MNKSEMLEWLQELFDRAFYNYRENGKNDYDAGICEGIKRAMELVSSM